VFCSLHIFSKYKGNTEAKQIGSQLIDFVMNDLQLEEPWSLGHRRVVQFRMLGDPEPDINHGYVQFLMYITKK
jgi:hypothetical protein